MALILKDRVKVTTTSTGTGAISLGLAAEGFQDFSVIGNGNQTYYTINDTNTGDWEVGIGTYDATGGTLSRDTILSSSNAGAAVNFAAGEKNVFVTYPAEKSSVSYYQKITSNYTTSNSEGLLTDTSGGAFTVTLPASPNIGDQLIIADAAGSWGTNNLTVARNGQTIEGDAEDLDLDINNAKVTFIYDGTTWRVYTQIGGQGGVVVTEDATQTLTNKTIAFGSNTLTDVASTNTSQTLTNKTIAFANNTLTDVASTNTAQALTNKTLVDPIIDLSSSNGIEGESLVSEGSGQPPVWRFVGTQGFITQYAGGNTPPKFNPDGFGII